MVADETEKVAKAMNSDWTREVLKAAAKALGGKLGVIAYSGPAVSTWIPVNNATPRVLEVVMGSVHGRAGNLGYDQEEQSTIVRADP